MRDVKSDTNKSGQLRSTASSTYSDWGGGDYLTYFCTDKQSEFGMKCPVIFSDNLSYSVDVTCEILLVNPILMGEDVVSITPFSRKSSCGNPQL